MPTPQPPKAGVTLRRFMSADPVSGTLDLDARTLTLSFSSDAPVPRSFGTEILSHAPGAANLDRLNDSAPLLFNHDQDQLLGVVERAWIADGKGQATVRFAQTDAAQEALDLVQDGILKNVSFMYVVDEYEQDGDAYVANVWTAYEISLVTVPADQSVGVGRSFNFGENSMTTEYNTEAPSRRARMREQDHLQAETNRQAALETLASQHGINDTELRTWVQTGMTVETARGVVLQRLMARGKQPGLANFGNQDQELGMGREAEQFSLRKAILAAGSHDWQDAGLERAAIRAAAKAAGRDLAPGSIVVPADVLRSWIPQTRAPYQVGTPTQGGNLVQTQLLAGSFIEVLRNKAVTTRLGSTVLSGLVGNVNIPRQATAGATYWVGESQAITESEATFDQVQLRPRTVGALSKMSRLMLLQATPAVEALARMDMINTMALAIDLAALSGSGTNGQPLGIVNTTGVNSVIGGTNGANLSFDLLAAMYSATRLANAPGGDGYGFAINSKCYSYLSTLKSTTGQYLWEPAGGSYGAAGDKTADTIRGYAYAVSNQLRYSLTKGTSVGTASEVIFGNWQELLIGEWGGLELIVNPFDSVGFTTGDVYIRAMQTLDIQLRHAASFSVLSDALTPGY